MTTEKTARAWFETLKEPYRSQAIKASEETVRISRIEKLYPSLSEALLADFTWQDTPQGWLYWNKIHTSIERGETTYLAEPPTNS